MPDLLHKVVEAETRHGKWLAKNDPVMQWGWGTPAGQLRAKRRAELIALGAELKPGMRVLEIGCGTGMFTEMFATYGANILAVDLSKDLLELAAKRNLPADRITFLASPFEECALHGPFDAIIGSSILHHLDCSKAFDKIYDLLRPGGTMSFCEPNMLNPQVWFILRFRKFFPYVSDNETAFRAKSLKKLLATAKFKNINVTPFDWLHPSVPSMIIPSVKKTEKIFEALPGVKNFSGSLCIVAKKPI